MRSDRSILSGTARGGPRLRSGAPAWILRGLVLLLFLFFLGIRVYHLSADPPLGLSGSGGFFGDGPAHAHAARNKVLYGQWVTDDWNPMIYSPFLTLLEYVSFSAFGVGLVQMRLVNALCTALGLAMLFFALKTEKGRGVSLLAVALLGTNYIYLMYSRLGLHDTFLSFVFLLTFFLWQKGLKRPPLLFLAGVSSFACYMSKGSAIYFVLVVFVSLVFAGLQASLRNNRVKSLLRPLVFYLGGLVVSILLWYPLFYLPNREGISSIADNFVRFRAWRSVAVVWKNVTTPTVFDYLGWSPVVLVVSFAYLPCLIWRILRNWRSVPPMEIFVLLWLLGGCLMIGSFRYKPMRYYVSLIPAFCILAAWAIDRILRMRPFEKNPLSRSLPAVLALTAWGAFVVALAADDIRVKVLSSGIITLGVLFVLGLAVRFVLQKTGTLSTSRSVIVILRGTFLAVGAAAAVIAVGSSMYLYAAWARDPSYRVINISRWMGKNLNKAYIAGLWAPLATIENTHRSLVVGEFWFNDENTFEKYPITHLFLWDGNNREEWKFFRRYYRPWLRRAKRVWKGELKGCPVRLIEVNRAKAVEVEAAERFSGEDRGALARLGRWTGLTALRKPNIVSERG